MPEQINCLKEYEIISINTALDFFKNSIDIMQWGLFSDILKIYDYLAADSKYYCVEHQESLVNEFKLLITDDTSKSIHIQYIPTDEPYLEGISDGSYKQFKNYILFPAKIGNKFDFIIINGRAKTDCFKYSWNLLSSIGIVVIIDSPKSENICTIKKHAYTLTISNPDIKEKDNRLLFISKNKDLLTNLHLKLSIILPKKTVFEQNFRNIFDQIPIDPSDLLNKKNKCLFVHTYPENYLEEIYSNGELMNMTYTEQKEYIISQYYGVSDFYSYNLRNYDWLTGDVIVNCEHVQSAWAKEKISVNTGYGILIDQLKEIKPEIVYLLDVSILTPDLSKEIKRNCNLLVAQIDNIDNLNPAVYALDIIFTSVIEYVSKFRAMGVTTYYLPHSFDSRVLNSSKSIKERKYNTSYIKHKDDLLTDDLNIIEALNEKSEITLWGEIVGLDENSKLLANYKSNAFGQKVYDIYSNSKIALCINEFENKFTNPQKMYDICGCGALLLTNYNENLNSVYQIGTECVAYSNTEEAIALIKFYIENPEDANMVAKAGQNRTLNEYSYTRTMAFISEILIRHLRYKMLKLSTQKSPSININDKIQRIEKIDINNLLLDAWKSPTIPMLQREIVQSELEQMYKCNTPILFDVLAKLLSPIINNNSDILEIGCSSGYYSEIIEYILGKKINYTGLDYSEAFINSAKELYPKSSFITANAEDIPLDDNSVDIVISSGVIQHSTKYSEQIASAVRVSGNYIIFHRLPICKKRPTHFNKKEIYSVDILEVRFNEQEIFDVFNTNNLLLAKSIEYYSNEKDDEYELSLLYKKQML